MNEIMLRAIVARYHRPAEEVISVFRGVEQIAKNNQVDPDVILAMIGVESSWNPYARRYEHAADRKLPDPDRPGLDDDIAEDDASYGLMQIMGSTARKLCFRAPDFTNLYDVELNLTFGCKLMSQLLHHSNWNYAVALARYNGGYAGNPRPDGSLRNQDYVDRALMEYLKMRKHLDSLMNTLLAVYFGRTPAGDAK